MQPKKIRDQNVNPQSMFVPKSPLHSTSKYSVYDQHHHYLPTTSPAERMFRQFSSQVQWCANSRSCLSYVLWCALPHQCCEMILIGNSVFHPNLVNLVRLPYHSPQMNTLFPDSKSSCQRNSSASCRSLGILKAIHLSGQIYRILG